MKRLIQIACVFILASCSAAPILPPAQLTTLKQTCALAGPTLSAAASSTMPATVNETAAPAAAYCQQLNGGVVPPTTDSNTPTWLPQVIAGVQVAATVAKIALPLILPLL